MESLSLSKVILLVEMFIVCVFLVACGVVTDPAPIALVTNTQNPLVAQFWVGSACAGQAMVEFGPDTSYGRTTAWYSVSSHYRKTSILVAGMKASTTYHMRAQVQCVGNTVPSEDFTFATGPLPSIPFPTLQVTRPNPGLATSESPA